MILFPAIDIKDGQCVRLRQGKADQVTVFSRHPMTMAEHWTSLGASALHLVDLDGAFSGRPVNFNLIQMICQTTGIPAQLGGGIRDLETAAAYFNAGVDRLIVSTMALDEPELFSELCIAWPGRIGVSLDAEDGRLKTKGWVAGSARSLEQVLADVEKRGAAFLVYTDISRDGMHSGPNLPALKALLKKTSLPVTAAGGVSTLDDIKALSALKNLYGIITGRAIYENTLDLKAALNWLKTQI